MVSSVAGKASTVEVSVPVLAAELNGLRAGGSLLICDRASSLIHSRHCCRCLDAAHVCGSEMYTNSGMPAQREAP